MKEKEFILKFLNRAYPIERVKYNNKFKRALIIEDTTYFMNNNPQSTSARLQLFRIIKNVFDCNDEMIISVLNDFLKKY